MKIDLGYFYKTFDGQKVPKMDPSLNPETGKPHTEIQFLTLRDVLKQVLLIPRPTEKISGDEKERRCILAEEVHKAINEYEFGIDDLKMLKDLVDEHYPPLVVRQTRQILDPKGEENGKREDNLKSKSN